MNDKFFDLPQEKQDRIINASCRIFASSAYRHASTDEIVKAAGISKGLLFHYFGSKIGLYGFLFAYSVRFTLLELSREVKPAEKNFFSLMMQMEKARMQVMRLYPWMPQFISQALRETGQEAVGAICEKRQVYKEQTQAYLAQADYSIFPQEGDADRMVRLIRYAAEGMMKEMADRGQFSPEKLYAEICAYLKLLHRMQEGSRDAEADTENG